MRKHKLIELLQSISGNHEIMVWNTYVGDFMHIDCVSENDLIKPTLDHYMRSCLNQDKLEFNDLNIVYDDDEINEIKKMYQSNIEWECASGYTINTDRYMKKRVVLISTKKSNKTTYDRICKTQY